MSLTSWLVFASEKACYNQVYHREGQRFMAVRLRVREVAQEKGVGIGKLQRTADVAYNTVKRMFRDPYYITTTETLGKIARALGVPPGELIEEVLEEQSPAAREHSRVE
jgi:DNA-binding Xre family transcriptional regulator